MGLKNNLFYIFLYICQFELYSNLNGVGLNGDWGFNIKNNSLSKNYKNNNSNNKINEQLNINDIIINNYKRKDAIYK